MQKYVPVVDKNGKPLMPTDNKKADRLIAKGRAVRRFDRGLFYIQIIDREGGYTQPIAIGIDTGSKREALTLKSEAKTLLNIQVDAITWVKEAEETSTTMRRGRRDRNAPYRQRRNNRRQGQFKLPPSTRARWGWKLRLCNWLGRYYPIDTYVVEDIKAKTWKGAKRYNRSFSPLEVGKAWFYEQLTLRGRVKLYQGHETAEERNDLGLKKLKDKMSDKFEAHCVDSFCLANMWVGGHTKPDNKAMMYIVPLRFHRRQLHLLQPAKGGVRRLYGSTNSLGFKRGSWVKHPKHGVCYVGGTTGGTVSLHDMQTGSRIAKVKPTTLQFLTRSSWRIRKGVSASPTRLKAGCPRRINLW